MPTSSVRKKLDRWKMIWNVKQFRTRQVILHQYAKFYPNRTTLSRKKWHHDGGSQPSYRSSIDTIALNCLVFEKLAFFGVATRWQKNSKICLFVLTWSTNVTDTQTPHDAIFAALMHSIARQKSLPPALITAACSQNISVFLKVCLWVKLSVSDYLK